MKKTLVLASLLAAFGAASAQSTVTLGGATSFAYQKAMSTSALTGQPNKGLYETDFGLTFRGVEQLGGGLSAAFSIVLDNSGAQAASQTANAIALNNANQAVATATAADALLSTPATVAALAAAKATAATAALAGAQNFRATVQRKDTSLSLRGGFGSVTLTNTRSSETANMAFVAATNLDAGFYDGAVFARAPIDLLGYSTNPMGGLTLSVSFSESGKDGGTTPAGRATTLSARYAAGPLTLAGAFKRSTNNVTSAMYRAGNFELGAVYDLGVARVGFGYDSKPSGITAPAVDKAAFAFGVSVPFGTSSVGVNFAKRDFAKITEVGYQNNLSARTNVNLSVGSMTTAPNTSRGQYRVSLNHAF